MSAYRQSKIACGLFGLELATRSTAAGWGLSSTISHPGEFYGPRWPGNAGGPPGAQKLWEPLRDRAAADRLWDLSERLTGVRFG